MTSQATEISTARIFVAAASSELLDATMAFVSSTAGDHADIEVVALEDLAALPSRVRFEDASMIVMAGYRHPDGSGETVNDPALIALDSPVPVMVLRAAEGELQPFPKMQRILVPLDGSSRSAQALPVATRIAHKTGLPVHLVMVIDPSRVLPPAYAYDPDAWDIITELRETAHWALRQAEEPLMREGVAVESSLLYGPVNAILQSTMEPEDIVVMTTHGTGMARRKIGSVAARVLATAPGPVVIHRGGDQGDIVVDGYEACSWVEPLSRRAGAFRRS